MNKPTCKKLRKVAKLSNSAEIVGIVEPVLGYGLGRTWNELVERRGEDFHRWRPQTHGIQGVPRRSPWQHDATSRSLGIGTPIYNEADGLAQSVALLSDQAMLELADAMEAFYDPWPAASNALGGPRYEVSRQDEPGTRASGIGHRFSRLRATAQQRWRSRAPELLCVGAVIPVVWLHSPLDARIRGPRRADLQASGCRGRTIRASSAGASGVSVPN